MHERPAGDRRRRRHSWRHSVLLLAAMAALLGYCGWIVAGWDGILWSLVGGAAMVLMLARVPPGVLLQALNAHLLARWEAPALYKILEGLCGSARIEQPPLLFRVFERGPLAFTIDGGSTAAIVLSQSLLDTMTGREIRGILAHEIIHLRNGDLALMRVAVVVGRLTGVLSQLAFMLVLLGFFLRIVSVRAFPMLPLLVLAAAPFGVNLLQLALSRTREAEADLEAAELTGDPHGLASALVKMRNQEQQIRRRWSPVALPLHLPPLLRDHPATEDRIRRLMAMAPPPQRSPAGDSPQESRRRPVNGPWG
jgi:heat shock protein HtpX